MFQQSASRQRELPLGRVVATPGVLAAVSPEEVAGALARHRCRDWGDLSPEDRAANDQAVVDRTRVLSAYKTASGVSFWIITEADRSATTVLLPTEY